VTEPKWHSEQVTYNTEYYNTRWPKK